MNRTRRSAPPSLASAPRNILVITPFPSPTRENIHEAITRLDEVWNCVNDSNSEERHRLTFAEMVPTLGVPGTRVLLRWMNREEELRRLNQWAESNPNHRNSNYGPYAHLLGLNPDPEWHYLLTPSIATIEMLNYVVNNGFNATLVDEPIPYFPSSLPPSLINAPRLSLTNPFLELPSNPNS